MEFPSHIRPDGTISLTCSSSSCLCPWWKDQTESWVWLQCSLLQHSSFPAEWEGCLCNRSEWLEQSGRDRKKQSNVCNAKGWEGCLANYPWTLVRCARC